MSISPEAEDAIEGLEMIANYGSMMISDDCSKKRILGYAALIRKLALSDWARIDAESYSEGRIAELERKLIAIREHQKIGSPSMAKYSTVCAIVRTAEPFSVESE